MARCSCGNATCSCVVQAGEGIVVTGSGSPTRPYEIAVEAAANVRTLLDVADTKSLDLSIAGAGSATNKAVISGVVKLATLDDIADPEGPQVGDVPVWMGNHWEFRPPTTVAPGVIQTSHGVGGDGSIATPIIAKTAAEWGSPPLDSSIVGDGGILSTDGQTIYVDSAGNLRARPQVAYFTTTKPASDLPSTYRLGLTLMTISTANATAGGWPNGVSASVLTQVRWDSTISIAAQWWYRQSNTIPQVLYRSGNSSGWSPWVEVGSVALPAPLDSYNAADQTIVATSRVTETPTTVRAQVTNPHPTRRMLVRCLQSCWNQWSTLPAAVSAFYLDPMTISGGTVAVPATNARYDVPISGTLYNGCVAEHNAWVDPGATLVMGVGATRGTSTGTCVIRFVHNSLIPIRYE